MLVRVYVLPYDSSTIMDWYKILKRLIDIIGGLVGLLIFSPVLLITALWIKVVSPEGPIFADIPDRVGKDRKPFKLLKFRSMIPNAHEYLLKHPKLHEKYVNNNYKLDPDEDPRLIKGAKFIRKYSIDEMPQFLNVLKGDMSLVGPRAYYFFELDEQLERYPNLKPLVDSALTVKPGVTGTWQVSGRSSIGFEGRIRLDAEYAKRRSILYDLLIILKTPLVVLRGDGAF